MPPPGEARISAASHEASAAWKSGQMKSSRPAGPRQASTILARCCRQTVYACSAHRAQGVVRKLCRSVQQRVHVEWGDYRLHTDRPRTNACPPAPRISSPRGVYVAARKIQTATEGRRALARGPYPRHHRASPRPATDRSAPAPGSRPKRPPHRGGDRNALAPGDREMIHRCAAPLGIARCSRVRLQTRSDRPAHAPAVARPMAPHSR